MELRQVVAIPLRVKNTQQRGTVMRYRRIVKSEHDQFIRNAFLYNLSLTEAAHPHC
jgi:hypothetical protein